MDFLGGPAEAEEKPPTSLTPLSSGYKLVPWLSWTEWESVTDSLFSGSPEKVSFALNRISTWRSRGSLPVVVDVTASIVEIQQKDPLFVDDSRDDVIHSEQMLAMLYCMAILRLVNCVVEKTRKKTAISIGEAASAIGIPRTLIDVRHEGSHRDLPALSLVRDSAVKAIDWLRAYYWEPQTEQIPFQRDGSASVRKEIKSQLRQLASCVKDKQLGGSFKHGKRSKHPEQLCGRSKLVSLMASKSHSSKSGGFKKQINKIVKTLCRLYSSFSSEVISVVFDYLCKALDSLDPMEPEDGQETRSLLDVWKLVIVQLANKEPELLLMLLKAVLNKIEDQTSAKCETAASLEQMRGTGKAKQLSSLFAWLVEKLKGLKSHNKDALAENKPPSMGNSLSRATLVGLLRKCLLIVSHGNVQLLDSAMHLTQLIGTGSSTSEKLKKLSLLSMSSVDASEDSTSLFSSTGLLSQQDRLIEQAANKLQSAKCRRYKSKHVGAGDSNVQRSGRWVVAESWNPCPIGMLPRELGSSGRLPDLDVIKNNVHSLDPSTGPQTWALKRCRDLRGPGDGILLPEHKDTEQSCKKREAGWDIGAADNASAKRIREFWRSQESDAEDVHQPDSVSGCLFSNGIWKKLGEEELVAIQSSLRILV